MEGGAVVFLLVEVDLDLLDVFEHLVLEEFDFEPDLKLVFEWGIMITIEKVNVLKIKQAGGSVVGSTYSVEISVFPVDFIEKSDLSLERYNIDLGVLNSCRVYHFMVVLGDLI